MENPVCKNGDRQNLKHVHMVCQSVSCDRTFDSVYDEAITTSYVLVYVFKCWTFELEHLSVCNDGQLEKQNDIFRNGNYTWSQLLPFF